MDGLTQLHADVIQVKNAVTRRNTSTFVIMPAIEMQGDRTLSPVNLAANEYDAVNLKLKSTFVCLSYFIYAGNSRRS